jgi:nucleotide-binding universal stress UspA family protein
VANTRIMVAVSSPWASDKLVDAIRDLARRLKASVIVAHVAQPQDDDVSPQDMRLRAEQTLANMTTRLAESKITSEGVLLFGDDIARAIINASKAHNASLLVLGASGKGRMARLLAGDVPGQVVRGAVIPVLLLPPEWSGTI